MRRVTANSSKRALASWPRMRSSTWSTTSTTSQIPTACCFTPSITALRSAETRQSKRRLHSPDAPAMRSGPVRAASVFWSLVLGLLSCGRSSDSPDPSSSGGAGGAGVGGARGGGASGNGAGNGGRVSRGGASGASSGGAAGENSGGAEPSVGGGSSGSSAGASETPVEGGTAGAGGTSDRSGAPAEAGSGGFNAGAAGTVGAGGGFSGALPICPYPGLGGARGECDPDTEAALATVRLELGEIENASTGEPLRPG